MKKVFVFIVSTMLLLSLLAGVTSYASSAGLGSLGDYDPEHITTAAKGTDIIAGIDYVYSNVTLTEDPPAILAYESRLAGQSGIYKNIAICCCENYVNIREEASASSAIIGKIYDDSAAHITATLTNDEGTWYRIYSGSCEGYIKSEYFLTGQEAQDIAASVSTMYATVEVESLRLRKEPSLESETITLLSTDEKYTVVKIEGDFAKITIDDDLTGYVYSDYVKLSVKFKEAISIEEEQAELARQAELERQRRLAEEAAEQARIKASQEAAKKKTTTAAKTTTKSSTTKTTTTAYTGSIGSSAGSVSDARYALCEYAESWVGVTPYVYGGTSLTSGADCSGFTKQIFKKFGITLPRTSYEQRSCGERISADEMRPGDLVCYDGHVAIYVGNGMVVHASSSSSNPNTKYSSWNYRTVLAIVNPWGD